MRFYGTLVPTSRVFRCGVSDEVAVGFGGGTVGGVLEWSSQCGHLCRGGAPCGDGGVCPSCPPSGSGEPVNHVAEGQTLHRDDMGIGMVV
jgi:hypothetical protein